MATMAGLTLTSLVGIPINFASTLVANKRIINTSKVAENLRWTSKLDINNAIANANELALMMFLRLLALGLKGLFTGDDEDDVPGPLANIAINTLQDSANQISLFYNPFAITEQFTDIPVTRTIDDVYRFAIDIRKSDEIVTSGSYKGLTKQEVAWSRLFMPVTLRGIEMEEGFLTWFLFLQNNQKQLVKIVG